MPRKRASTSTRASSTANGLDDYPEQFIDCRDLLHSWTRVGYYRNGNHIVRETQCSRCGAVRYLEMDASSQIMHSHYRYPQGYLHKKGIKPFEARAAALSRFKVYRSESELYAAAFNG